MEETFCEKNSNNPYKPYQWEVGRKEIQAYLQDIVRLAPDNLNKANTALKQVKQHFFVLFCFVSQCI